MTAKIPTCSFRPLFATAVLTGSLLVPCGTATAAAPPELHVTDSAVTVSGLVPGAEVAWVAVGRIPEVHAQRVLLFVDVTTADGEGVASLAADWFDFSALGVPVRSVWAAVEIATGRLAVGAPDDYGDREVAFPADGLQPGRSGESDEVRAAGRISRLLLVRPGETGGGAWFLAAGDGTARDADRRADGRVQVALSTLVPLGATVEPAPLALAAGDVLISLDPDRMTAAVAVLEASGRQASGPQTSDHSEAAAQTQGGAR